MFSSLFGKRKESTSPAPALGRLRTQVYSREYFGIQVIEKTRSPIAMRPLADGLVEAIVEDLGGGERMMSWNALDELGKPRDELFALGRRQAAAAETGIQSQMLDGGMEVLISNGFYMSAVLLDTMARDPGKGMLFVPLSWHHWCLHTIDAMSVAPHVAMLALVAEKIGEMMQVKDAERLSDAIYWYKPDHTIVRIGKEITLELAAALG